MNISSFQKRISVLAVSGLTSLAVIGAPSVAHAAPVCTITPTVTTCQGVGSDGAPYYMLVPANFKGTVYLWSHGYRYNVDIPSAIPLIGGYKVVNAPEPTPGGSPAITGALLSQGYAVMGSGFARQGWNPTAGVAADVELIKTFKDKFPATTNVIAWGESLGGFITQTLAEQHPELISAAAPVCLAGSIDAELTGAGDFLWGLKTFFDPSITVAGYGSGTAGYALSMQSLGKVFTVMGKLQATMTTGAWPDTAPDVLKNSGIPARSALVLLGLMSGLPSQSAHFDGTTGPGSVNSATYTGFSLLYSPALAMLENGTSAAALGVLANADVEDQSGGIVFDNSKTDYAARLDSDASTFSAALSGSTATNALLGYLAQAPRVTADPAAVAKLHKIATYVGKISVPTITMVGLADPITPAGASMLLAQKYAVQYQAQKVANLKAHKPKGPSNLITIWQPTPTHYSTFDATGLPVTSTPAANGTNHCNFTTKQYLAVADLLAYASATGKQLSGGPLRTKVRKMGGAVIDPKLDVPLMKFDQN
jgi:pimeloyl-ACP methyl ester carboxylesterase